MLVKVCGMRQVDNIQALAELDIDYMGFIFYKNSKRYVQHPPLTQIPPAIKKVAVFVNPTFAEVQQRIQEGFQHIQLHGNESPDFCQSIKTSGITLIKAFGVQDNMDWEPLAAYLEVADYFLFDTSSTAYGGTGTTFDWSLLQAYPYDKPYFLSGGLDLSNIQDALALHAPNLIGLDLNSRFELTPGLKNIEKIKQALKIIKDE